MFPPLCLAGRNPTPPPVLGTGEGAAITFGAVARTKNNRTIGAQIQLACGPGVKGG